MCQKLSVMCQTLRNRRKKFILSLGVDWLFAYCLFHMTCVLSLLFVPVGLYVQVCYIISIYTNYVWSITLLGTTYKLG